MKLALLGVAVPMANAQVIVDGGGAAPGNSATSDFAVAAGEASTASGTHSLAVGDGATASGSFVDCLPHRHRWQDRMVLSCSPTFPRPLAVDFCVSSFPPCLVNPQVRTLWPWVRVPRPTTTLSCTAVATPSRPTPLCSTPRCVRRCLSASWTPLNVRREKFSNSAVEGETFEVFPEFRCTVSLPTSKASPPTVSSGLICAHVCVCVSVMTSAGLVCRCPPSAVRLGHGDRAGGSQHHRAELRGDQPEHAHGADLRPPGQRQQLGCRGFQLR